MTQLVDQSIAELRATHDRLRSHVEALSPDQLTGPSGAEAWTMADLLSHLGSGAEIARGALLASLGDETEERRSNQEVWDRWNALSPDEQAAGALVSDARLVELYEGLTPDQRETTMVDLGFLPAPVPLATALAMRLNEQVLHEWDVRVAVDPDAALTDTAADLLLQHYREGMSFMLGFIGKPDRLDEPTRVALDDVTLAITDAVSLDAGTDDTTATYAGPREAVVRLIAGRLGEQHTPSVVDVSGNVTLDDLRRVFPGF
jgi:uncharacterized protein (TIGR03083 family)